MNRDLETIDIELYKVVDVLCFKGPEIKFKGVLHPLIISPTRVMELFEVSVTEQGG